MIDAKIFREAIISGANNIFKSRIHINELNIFPVPDGDTGTNMSLTAMGAAKEMRTDVSTKLCDAVSTAASAALMSSRGNSGVILSILLKGMAKSLAGTETVGIGRFVEALGEGVAEVYSSVAKPTEGTMLTVMRVAHERGKKALEESADMAYVWGNVCEGARDALTNTPDLLPVLKKAGVVDSGGKGLCLIFEGILSVFFGKGIIEPEPGSEWLSDNDGFRAAADAFKESSNYTYCNEFIIFKSSNCEFDAEKFRKILCDLGDCAVVVENKEIFKTHVHSNLPDKVIGEGLKYGQIIDYKIDNLEEQRKEALEAASAHKNEEIIECSTPKYVEPSGICGVVAIACGNGIVSLFKDLGASYVVIGGQTMNPSAKEIADAVLATPAKTVFVLPNNKNIIMTAQQASSFVKDRNLVVIKSRSIPQGISAISSFIPDSPADENIASMNAALKSVKSGYVTFAERDSEFSGFRKIKKGDALALFEGKLKFAEKSPEEALFKLVKFMANKRTEFITVIYGVSLKSEEVAEAKQRISEKFNWAELNFIYGGNEIYYFIVSVE